MRRMALLVMVAAVIFTLATTTASSLSLVGASDPRFGVAAAPQACGLTSVEVVAAYYIVAPKTAYYSGFDVRGSGSDEACAALTAYIRVTHEGHAYYLKIAASEVSEAWAQLGVFEAAEGQPLVYATREYSAQHIVAADPKVEHSIFTDTSVVVATSPPADW